MSLSNKGFTTNDKKLNTRGKAMTLNPNAAEFIPFALRSSAGSTSTADLSTSLGASGTGTLGKAVIDRSESSISNNSDDEAHQFWRHQLPDDITPDFKVMGEDESLGINSIPFSTLSLNDGNETFRFSPSTGSGFILKEQHELSSQGINRNSFAEKMRYSVASYGEDASSANFLHLPTKPWGKPIVDNDQVLTTIREGLPYNGNSRQGMLNEQAIAENTEMNPLEFLASQFPGFAAESLAEVYVANGGDLNLTIEMLTQLELQDDGGLNQNFNPKALSAPNLSALDFPVLSVQDVQNGLPKYAGDDIQQSFSPHRSASKDSLLLFKSNSSIPTRSTTDFASAVRKMSSQDSGIWKYDRNGSADASVGSSRTANVLASSYNGGRGIYGGDRLQSRSSSQAAPVWLETGEAAGNMYSEMRGEARDHSQLRNAYFEQAQQAYLFGNKALAKELTVKGQVHNMHLRAAHGKAQESIYRQRNPVNPEIQGNGRGGGQERMIDLHGLHVSEALHVLKHELALLRSTAKSVEQRLQVYVCVGTGHHTRGSRTPVRLPIAVQRYLLEEEGLDYSEPQPGLLRVVIC
ncbi:Polyadenylate-binding protein-interacting protein 7 [Camellia lanceoleosa]|uniref:Polyadenylate-binding protein-interacting protein 7 n=1 Tax=Camellia lanceoleosa TaxID=1840588 RepID=A0ACC0GAK9_9ERIC|nr:Polyadenylate-binding protein-interacting protein 7 [Camellia lanceoleosa]